jgi:hypothetical protein
MHMHDGPRPYCNDICEAQPVGGTRLTVRELFRVPCPIVPGSTFWASDFVLIHNIIFECAW